MSHAPSRLSALAWGLAVAARRSLGRWPVCERLIQRLRRAFPGLKPPVAAPPPMPGGQPEALAEPLPFVDYEEASARDVLALLAPGDSALPAGWLAGQPGRRFFAVSPEADQPPGARQEGPGLWRVSLPWPGGKGLEDAPLDEARTVALLEFFDTLRREHGLVEASVLPLSPAWEPLADALRDASGWPRVEPGAGESLDDALLRALPSASIVIVTYNNLAYNKLCLESLLRHRGYPNFEIIVVDNASADGTPDFLREMEAAHPEITAILNPDNRGFAAANNQGLAVARGERLVLLNNDTVVPRGWLTRLLRHLEDPSVGLAGPVTNSAGNEARIPVSYSSHLEVPGFALAHYARHPAPERFDIAVLAMYCVAMRRDVFERVGPLDERFGVGMFEDDDYAHRVRLEGLRVVCCDDVFVHHFGETSFNKLKTDGRYRALFEENRAKFESKWGVAWKPHTYRKEFSG